MGYKKGNIPWAKGRNFTEVHKRKLAESKIGEKNPNWKGDNAGWGSVHERAIRKFQCPLLDWLKLERHHIDGNPWNNDSSNIDFVTRKEHMVKDGRLDKLIVFDRNRSVINYDVFIQLYNSGLDDREIGVAISA